MPQSQLTGTRIRDRRMDQGMRQADLARAAGISPSYLNLIEHNRRRIGGKLVNDISRVLGIDPTLLTEGGCWKACAVPQPTCPTPAPNWPAPKNSPAAFPAGRRCWRRSMISLARSSPASKP